MKRTILFTILMLLLMTGVASAVQYPEHQGGFVNDFAGVLSQEAKDRIEGKIVAHEKKTTDEIAVVIVKDLQGVDIKEYAVKLFEKWGIGKKGKDNGILVLIATEEKGRYGGRGRRKIEVGYGLEGAVPDAVAGDILRKNRPLFDKGDIAGSTEGIVDDLTRILEQKGAEQPTKASSPADSENKLLVIWIVCSLIAIIAIFLSVMVIITLYRKPKNQELPDAEDKIEPPAPRREYRDTRIPPSARTSPGTARRRPIEHEQREEREDTIRTTRARESDEEERESSRDEPGSSGNDVSFGGGSSGGGGAED